MKVLTKNTDYAVRALLELASRGQEFISAKEISDRQKIPYEYLRKILSRLIKEGMIESKEGGSGGVKLKVLPKTIKIADLIRIFQGNVQISECMFRQNICPNRASCVLRKNILKVEQKMISELSSITIEKLINTRDQNEKKYYKNR